MNVLVVGGAGYIGSHMVKLLHESGYGITVLDDLSCGYADAITGGTLVEGSYGDPNILEEIFRLKQIDSVIHFGGNIQVSESTEDPAKYYKNNFANTQVLVDSMLLHDVKQMVFSSTAAIFGNPKSDSIDEQHQKAPINPYGNTKYMVEVMLEDYAEAYGLNSICLRYFNAAGADPNGMLGERHEPETHLIPLILQAAAGRREHIGVFGTDYDTPDGSCVRDYIHVNDLAQAHLLALKHLQAGGSSAHYNLGNGKGFSVLQVIEMAKKVTKCKIPVINYARRLGDPDVLVANSSLAKTELGWKPEFQSLEKIIEHAWNWEKKHWGKLDS